MANFFWDRDGSHFKRDIQINKPTKQKKSRRHAPMPLLLPGALVLVWVVGRFAFAVLDVCAPAARR